MNIMHRPYGADRLRKPISIAILLSLALLSTHLTVQHGVIVGLLFMALPLVFFYLVLVFKTPKLGMYTILLGNFLFIGLFRYIPFQWGLVFDGLFLVIFLALFFKTFKNKVLWKRANSSLTVLGAIWLGYILLQAFNPEAPSIMAWLYVMRGLAMYPFLMTTLVLVLFYRYKDMHWFFISWGILSLLGTCKGIQQLYFLDAFEQKWLNSVGHITHLLFGRLRIFSFYTDAGQFGASQAHAALVFGILGLYVKSARLRSFFFFVCLLSLFGMFISGTRGAIAVPMAGGMAFLILRKKLSVILAGVLLGVGVYVFFKHTTLMQSNYQIRRMRTAFDSQNPSLQVRLSNQKKLGQYLASRPFGGGVGATGAWGQRFSPNTFLSTIPTDSWYVFIWSDTGIVGLSLYLFLLAFIVVKGSYNVLYKVRDDWLRAQIIALICGTVGIMACSYGNGVIGQFPTSLLIYTGMAYMFIAPKIDQELTQQKNGLNPLNK